ncbi:IclR family transcriptional regulator C-terminal domain-containing protein [Kribbella sp. HUAS MG21]|uniref:IclR family transcriptional regulator C-terminal domain-containing protein n=1 Tax=Kribbella sp. HUAS MG21 TaxID=3160966 RepID=A0AAU7TFS7_9ACTN
MSVEGTERDYVQSIERGFAVLLAFDADHPSPTLAELATATGLSRPAVRRILLTLQKLGYVAAQGPRWTLTPRVLTIGQHYAATHSFVETAQPHLLRLAEETQESASLAQLDGTDVVYVARVQVRRIMAISVDVGSRVPAHATSMGRVLMAWSDADVVDAVLAAGLPRLAQRTITDPTAFRDALHKVRMDGYAVVESELEDGLLSASVPVRTADGSVLAALAYSTTVGRRTEEQVVEKVIPLMQEAAAAISADLRLLSGARRLDTQARDGFY